MRATAALRHGLRRVNRAPVLLLGVCAVTLLVALPLAVALRGMLESHLARSLAAGPAASGVNYDWWQEFSAQAHGLGTTFAPSIAGFGAVLDNLSGLLDNAPLATTIAGATAAWLLVWSFLTGGIIDRLARERRTRSAGFFTACGTHVWRLLRLGVLALLVYAFLFGWVHGWIFDDAIARVTRDLSVERTAFVVQLVGYAVFGGLLLFVNVIFDYARIRTVIEDRRSALFALAAGARFVRRHVGRVAALYALNGCVYLVVVTLYALLTPGAPGDGIGMWAALLLGQAYIIGRHYVKLLFYASQTALFQGALAHTDYTAAPALVWPESPAVESITNARPAAR